jgi:hypothetical protein
MKYLGHVAMAVALLAHHAAVATNGYSAIIWGGAAIKDVSF